MKQVIIRPFQISDTPELIALFRATVREINIRHYSQEQVQTWAPETIDNKQWEESLQNNITFVTLIEGTIVGFADMTHQGYLDRLYVHKNYQVYGVAYYLFKALEQEAHNLNLSAITTHASITAKKPAERMGFIVIKEQKIIYNGVEFINYIMEKKLNTHE